MRPLGECNGRWTVIAVKNADTVCCAENLLVAALLTVGVPLHPRQPLRIEQHAEATLWIWLLGQESKDGVYKTEKLIEWWRDPAWRAANPAHEWTAVHNALVNLGHVAAAIRKAVPRIVVRQGNSRADIPANASAARREHLLGKLAGRIPLDERFVEPTVFDS